MAITIQASEIVGNLNKRLEELQNSLNDTRQNMLQAFNEGNIKGGKTFEKELKSIKSEINSTSFSLANLQTQNQNTNKIIETTNAGVRIQALSFLQANQNIQQLNAGLTLFKQSQNNIAGSLANISKPFEDLQNTITNKLSNIGSAFNFQGISQAFKKDFANVKTDFNSFDKDVKGWRFDFSNSFRTLGQGFKNAIKEIKPDSLTSAVKGVGAGLGAVGSGINNIVTGIAGLSVAMVGVGVAGVTAFSKITDTLLNQEKSLKNLSFEFNNINQIGVSSLYQDFQRLGQKIGATTEEVIKVTGELAKFKIDTSLIEQANSTISAIANTTGQSLEATSQTLAKVLYQPLQNFKLLEEAGIETSDSLQSSLQKIESPIERQKLLLQELQKQYGENARSSDLAFTQVKNKLDDALLNLTQNIFNTGDSWRDVMIKITEWSTKAVNFINLAWQGMKNTFNVFFEAVKDGLKTLHNGVIGIYNIFADKKLRYFDDIGEGTKQAVKDFTNLHVNVKKVGESFTKLEYTTNKVKKSLNQAANNAIGGVSKIVDEITKRLQAVQTAINNIGKTQIEIKVKEFTDLGASIEQIEEYKSKLEQLSQLEAFEKVKQDLKTVQTKLENINQTQIEIKVKEFTDLGASIEQIEEYKSKLEQLSQITAFEKVANDLINITNQINQLNQTQIEIKVKEFASTGASDEAIAKYKQQVTQLNLLNDIQKISKENEDEKSKTLENQLTKYQQMLMNFDSQKESLNGVIDVENARLNIIQKIDETNDAIYQKQKEQNEKLQKEQDEGLTGLIKGVVGLNSEWEKTFNTLSKFTSVLQQGTSIFGSGGGLISGALGLGALGSQTNQNIKYSNAGNSFNNNNNSSNNQTNGLLGGILTGISSLVGYSKTTATNTQQKPINALTLANQKI